MKKYCQPEWKVTMFETDDVITKSYQFGDKNDLNLNSDNADSWWE